MKTLFNAVIILSLSTVALAANSYNRYEKVFLTDKFQNIQVNLIGDNPNGGAGADVFLRGAANHDFIAFTKTRGSVTQCKVLFTKQVSASPVTTLVRFGASTEYDDGSSCFGIIHYKSGQTA